MGGLTNALRCATVVAINYEYVVRLPVKKSEYLSSRSRVRRPWRNREGLRCPRCGSIRLRLNGFILWASRKGTRFRKQRYFCRRCGSNTVTPKDGARRTGA